MSRNQSTKAIRLDFDPLMSPAPPPVDPGTCMLYLLRHGATANNLMRPPRLQGRRTDPELSEEGKRQAQAAAAVLADYSLSAIYTSPLRRARQTADLVAANHNLAPQIVDAITEVDVGDWEGRDWDEIASSEPEAYENFMSDPATYSYAGGESLQSVANRVLPAMQELLQQHAGQRIVVVAHNVVNRVVLADLMSIPLAKARTIAQKNCGINVIRRRDNATTVVTSNSAFHLER